MGATNLERAIIEKSFLFGLAQKTPIFIVNKRLYYCTNDDASPDFFIKDRNSKERRVWEGPSLAVLEKISAKNLEEEYQKFQEEFAAGELKKINIGDYDFNAASTYKKLALFALKEIFPYLKKDNSKELEGVLEIEPEKNKQFKEDKTPDKRYEKEIEDYVEKRIKELGIAPDRKKYPVKKISEDKLDRLLLGANPKNSYPNEENTEGSLLAKIIGKPNFAMDKDYFYFLENILYGPENLNIKGVKYSLSEAYPILELQKNFSAEIIQILSIDALKNKLKDSAEFEEFKKQRNDLESLCSRKEYHEGDFGFKRYSDHDNVIFVYLDVPEYVLEDPADKKLYRFDSHEVGVTIALNYDKPTLHAGPFNLAYAAGPFYGGSGGLCMGTYSTEYFGTMAIGKAFAKLLIDARNVVLHGYTINVKPTHHLNSFYGRLISKEEAKRKNLPITNADNHGVKRKSLYY